MSICICIRVYVYVYMYVLLTCHFNCDLGRMHLNYTLYSALHVIVCVNMLYIIYIIYTQYVVIIRTHFILNLLVYIPYILHVYCIHWINV